MDDNNLLMIILAFVFGYCLQGMMKNMCGGRLVEGATSEWCWGDGDCPQRAGAGTYCSGLFGTCLPL